ncbi:TPA: hypothetical protein SIA29_003964 [Aeromonas sobria]|uniref:hypothetical protein n=1 Tax=Aeromonas sobria TaxID=646 RepID=UPI0011DF3A9B|nr:hypothetical protein [Aeromonas sobria]HEH9428780.1 hypothetical protein [Aeromonas sobria]HEH9433068.1 hypothetical protein [Aeromonas sobria]
MDDLNKLISFYITKSQEIKSASERLTSKERTLVDMFSKQSVKKAQSRIPEFYTWLDEADGNYSKHLLIKRAALPPASGPTETERLAAELSVVSKSREIFVQSLSNFERGVTEVEGVLNFRLTTMLAILAIAVSLVTTVL